MPHTGRAPIHSRRAGDTMGSNMNDDQYRIIPYTEEYLESIHACLDAVARERKYLGFVKAPSLEETARFRKACLESGSPQLLLIDGNDTVVGWCDILVDTLEGFSHRGRLGMGVLSEYRGKHLGMRLALAAIAKAQELGLEKIELDVYASNITAMRLYEKIGFTIEGIRKKARKLEGEYDDIVAMGLFLNPSA